MGASSSKRSLSVKVLVSVVSVALGLAVLDRPAQSRDGFIAGAIIGGIAGAAIGGMISHHHRYYVPHRVRRTPREVARDDIRQVQTALDAFGFDAGPVTGKMNTQTRAAIKRFQQKIGEEPTGKLSDKQQTVLLTAYAKKNQDMTAAKRVSKIDTLFAALGVNSNTPGANATPGTSATPSTPTAPPAVASDPTVPNFGAPPATPAVNIVDAKATMRSICHDDQMTAMLRETASADTFKAMKLIPDQFCVARSHVLAASAEAYKAMTKKSHVTAERVRTECLRFAESKQAELDRMRNDPPAAFADKLIKKNTKTAARDTAVASSKICLGFGYADDNPQVVLASALTLMGLGETAYAELVGADFALGIGVDKDVPRAATWLNYAAAEIDAGAKPVVATDGRARSKVLHLVAQELQNPATPRTAAAPANEVIDAPQLFGPSDADNKPASATPAPIKTAVVVDPNLGRDLSERLSRAQLVNHMRENVVMIYNADEDSMGTGFFISPNYILTNTHVVGSASKVVVLNKSMRLKGGIVKYRGMTPDHVGIDAAIIQVLGYNNPTYMTFASNVREGEDVAIGGYPYRALRADRGFVQFLEMMKQNQLPTASQIPNTKYAFGVVQSVFTNNATGLENIQEGVETTGGNSGSPLVNDCGQVVALHYEGSQAEVQAHGNKLYVDASKYNYAISFREVLKFLRDAGIPYREAKVACTAQ